jgi:hypothetical protein
VWPPPVFSFPVLPPFFVRFGAECSGILIDCNGSRLFQPMIRCSARFFLPPPLLLLLLLLGLPKVGGSAAAHQLLGGAPVSGCGGGAPGAGPRKQGRAIDTHWAMHDGTEADSSRSAAPEQAHTRRRVAEATRRVAGAEAAR